MNPALEWLENSMQVEGSAGGEVLVVCPWCGRPKMYVNPERGVFVCFRCREKGKIRRLVGKVEGVGSAEADRILDAKTVEDSDELIDRLWALDSKRPNEEEPIVQPLPEEFIPCFLPNGEIRIPEYLDERGISDESILSHGLGYAEEGRYRDRILIPVIHGDHRTFLGRLMGHPRDFRWKHRVTGAVVMPPRYLSPRDAGLSSVVYGAAGVNPGAHLVGVEGAFDKIRLSSLGIPAIALFGKRISTRQAAIIRSLRPASFTALFDADASSFAYLDASRLVGSVPSFVAELPSGFDPDRLGRGKGGARRVQAVLDSRKPAGDLSDSIVAALKKLG